MFMYIKNKRSLRYPNHAVGFIFGKALHKHTLTFVFWYATQYMFVYQEGINKVMK